MSAGKLPITLKGRIDFRHVSGGSRIAQETPVWIEIMDDDAFVSVATVRLSLENFAEAIMGRGHVECEVDYYRNPNIGKTREHKTEIVSFSYAGRFTPAELLRLAKETLVPYEIDGWIGRPDDLLNANHRSSTGKGYVVGFTRWVEKIESPEAQRAEAE